MASDLVEHPVAQQTMARMEKAKRTNPSGNEFWLAREVSEILGYQEFRNFKGVMDRARDALRGNGINPSHHIVDTTTVVRERGGVKERGEEFFLSRAACYLISMNGDPSKPEVAGAQAYFTIQTRQAELIEVGAHDRARVLKREKVKDALKRVSDVAKDVGVTRYAIFHDAKYQGLYEMSAKAVARRKGLKDGENLLDRAGHLELSAQAFQADLAAEKILNDQISGEPAAIAANRTVARHVRKLMISEGGRSPEDLPLEPEPIQAVRKRLAKPKAAPPKVK